MRKTAMTLTSAALVCALLVACGQETLDSRQIDTTGGLAYKHGSNDPFTGNVTFKDTIPADLESYWTTNIASVPGHPVGQVLSGCQEHYVKGLPDGDASCDGTGSRRAFVLHYADEQFDGPSKLYNADTGDLIKEQSWSAGKLDGMVKTYAYDGKPLVAEVHWQNGQLDGSAKEWDIKGNKQTDATFKDGKVESGTVGTDNGTVKTSTDYRDGTLDGPYSSTTEDGTLQQKGSFSKGSRSGAWDDRNNFAYEIVIKINTYFSNLPNGFNAPSRATHIISHWQNGKLEGEMRGWDEHEKPVFDVNFSNDKMVGSAKVTGSDPGPFQTFNVDAAGDSLESGIPDPASPGNVAALPQASAGASEAQSSAVSSVNSPAEALAGSVQAPGTGNQCLDDWEAAYRKERGADAVIAYDQIDEWTDECKQGKTAPKN